MWQDSLICSEKEKNNLTGTLVALRNDYFYRHLKTLKLKALKTLKLS